ncbi:OmpA family protein [Tabrizicola sp. BL-A-41-H6]|uniref:OmpA family protein n=1 Tax=Tabrizicola sp. BL-A-41-H6 TaxID=3421107 RepID=UPI003D66F86F
MRRLLISTTALSVAMSPMATLPGFAQTLAEDGSVLGPDGSVLCIPTADLPCDIDAITAALVEAEAAKAATAEAEAAAAEAAAAAAAATEAAAVEAQQAEAAAAAAAEAEAQSKAAAEAAAAAEADANAQAEAEAAAAAAAEAQAAADAAAAEADAQAKVQAEAEAAATAAEEEAAAAAAAQVEAEAAAGAAEQAPAEEPAAEQPAVEEQPAAEAPVVEEPAVEEPAAEEPVLEEPAVEEPTAEQPAVEEPAVEEPAAEQPVAEEPAVEEPAAEAPVAEEPATEQPAAEEPVVEAPAAEAPVAEEPAAEEPAVEEPAVEEPAVEAPATEAEAGVEAAPADPEAAAAADAAALSEAEAELAVTEDGQVVDPAAGLATAPEDPAVAEAEPVDAPEVTETQVETLTNLLSADPTTVNPATLGAAETLAEQPAPVEGKSLLETEAPADAISAVTEVLTNENVRTSGEEFAAAPVAVSEGKKNKLSDLEKAGLVVLGALTVGALIRAAQPPADGGQVVNEGPVDGVGGGRVVSNTGDRVIVLQPDGTYRVLKDDDSIIRQPGSTVRTETYADGSTRTIVERADGTQVVTIRNATGRVLRRAQYDSQGREMVLIDDLAAEEVVYVEDLPKPRKRIVISSKDDDAALKLELAAVEADRAGRKFSLRQIRDIPEVRALAATIDVESITFASGSSAIAAEEARNLADLGRVMQDLLDENPAEIFLVEGHTDATGKAAMNLALSDRRAESVARALTEYFDIPPENMVIQGYGETELLVDTQANEPRNRRVEVRVISPLMRTASR